MKNQFDDLPIDFIDPSIEYYCSPITKASGFTLLMKYVLMVKKNESIIDKIKDIITNDPNEINKKNAKGWTALMLASRYSNIYSNIETVKLLLENGADPDIKDKEGYTALMFASRYSKIMSNIETVKLLLDNRADPNIQKETGWTALMVASRYSNTDSNTETVKQLLDNYANPNIQNYYGYTALMLASIYSNTDSNIETVKLLLENGADPNIQNKEGIAALMLASRCSNTISNIETVKQLIEYNANIDCELFKHLNDKLFEYALCLYFTKSIYNIQTKFVQLISSCTNNKLATSIYSDILIHKYKHDLVIKDISIARNEFYFHPNNITMKIINYGNKLFNKDDISEQDIINIMNYLGANRETLDDKVKEYILFIK